MKTLACALAIVLGVALGAAPASGQTAGLSVEFLYAFLPVTPEQAREVAALLRSPGAVSVEVADVTGAILDVAPSLPGALVHDVLTAPSRHLHLLHAVVTDVLDLGAAREDGKWGLFRHTVRALHRSATLSAAADLARRVTHPRNRTARLAIVLGARAHGLPVDTADLDLLREAIDRDAPDLAPLVARVLTRLAQMYGRDAVRAILTAR